MIHYLLTHIGSDEFRSVELLPVQLHCTMQNRHNEYANKSKSILLHSSSTVQLLHEPFLLVAMYGGNYLNISHKMSYSLVRKKSDVSCPGVALLIKQLTLIHFFLPRWQIKYKTETDF